MGIKPDSPEMGMTLKPQYFYRQRPVSPPPPLPLHTLYRVLLFFSPLVFLLGICVSSSFFTSVSDLWRLWSIVAVLDLASLECLESVIVAGQRYVDDRYQQQQEGCVIG